MTTFEDIERAKKSSSKEAKAAAKKKSPKGGKAGGAKVCDVGKCHVPWPPLISSARTLQISPKSSVLCRPLRTHVLPYSLVYSRVNLPTTLQARREEEGRAQETGGVQGQISGQIGGQI